MSARWTTEQVLARAPDERVAKAARGLVDPRYWSELGSNESLVWGKCKGSAKDAYQVTVDLAEPAFRCSCPSRKFPCKHGVALLLLWARGDGSVTDVEHAAAFAGEWADERARRVSGRVDRAAQAAARGGEPSDPEAQARREAQRIATMSAGLVDFERWCRDIVRQGLASVRRRPYRFWDDAAARLVDAQMPALAERVRDLGSAVATRPDWVEVLLAELGRWFLAARAWERRDALTPDVFADLRVVLGWPQRAAERATAPPLHDRWHVVGLRHAGDDRAQSQRTWLRGERSGERCVVLDFAVAGAALPVPHLLGSVVDADVMPYPGTRPWRVSFGATVVTPERAALVAEPTIADGLERIADVFAQNPWARRAPLALQDATIVHAGTTVVHDVHGRSLPVADHVDVWPLLALTGGRPTALFGEWEDDCLTPLSLVVDGALVGV